MQISVITAVYNRAGTIAEAVESVARQTHRPLEHIIQDGGSTDGTLQVLEEVCTGIVNVRSEPDQGLYDAINRGISRATGDIIGLMHSDDFFAHENVLSLVAEIMSDPAVDGVFGDLQYVAADNPSRVVRNWKAGAFLPAKLRRGWMPPHPTFYLRREVFSQWGLYDTGLKISADYDAMLRYLVKGGINLAYIPEVLVKMRVGGASNKSLRNIILKSREDFMAIRRHNVGSLGTLANKNIRKIVQYF
ncbi:glycosyltransferase [Novosphingobium sp. MW5]|nr:glycosyltransferase [Novosphingobium sp. MW5]